MIEIYGKPACPYCDRAKKFCESNQFEFVYKQLDEDFTREQLFEKFQQHEHSLKSQYAEKRSVVTTN